MRLVLIRSCKKSFPFFFGHMFPKFSLLQLLWCVCEQLLLRPVYRKSPCVARVWFEHQRRDIRNIPAWEIPTSEAFLLLRQRAHATAFIKDACALAVVLTVHWRQQNARGNVLPEKNLNCFFLGRNFSCLSLFKQHLPAVIKYFFSFAISVNKCVRST